jgi:hypothetical protein
MFKKINLGLFVTILVFGGCVFQLWLIDKAAMRSNTSTIVDTAYLLSPSEQMKRNHAYDSLPYYRYKKIEDSLEQRATSELGKRTPHPGFAAGIGFIAVRSTWRSWYDYTNDRDHLDKDYNLSLPFYSVEPGFSTEFQDGKSYLRYPVWDKQTGNASATGHSATKEISVSYMPETNEILVPISEKKFFILRNIFLGILFCFYFVMLYVIIGIPVNFLRNISRGKVFTQKNIRNLQVTASVLLGYFLLRMLAPYVVGLIYSSKIPSGFSISFSNLFWENCKTGLTGLIVLLIARAFAKGYKLQQEQDLTI